MTSYTTTYSDLVSNLQDYVEDDATEYVAELPRIINRAEDRCIRDLNLSVFNVTDTDTTTDTVSTLTRPTDAIKLLYIRLTASNAFLERRSEDWCAMYDTGDAIPEYFWEDDGANITLSPTPDAAYAVEIRSLKRPTALASGNQTNWLTDHFGDGLLQACLIESQEFLKAPEYIATHKQAYMERIQTARIEYEGLEQTAYKPIQPNILNVG